VPLTDPLEQASDLELVKFSQETDEKAFAEIVRRYSPRVFQIASRFFRDRSQVEDASQEVFLRAYTHLGDYEGRGSLEGWLTRIATTTCLNLLRIAQRQPESALAEMPEGEADWLDKHLREASANRHRAEEKSREAADLADRVLGTLSPDDRLVLMLVDADEMPIKDVASTTGWSESKVKVRAFRARRRMREAVERLLVARKRNPSNRSVTEVEG
jgi:RNA polymerase sigma-70 factor (ECF subfamily)